MAITKNFNTNKITLESFYTTIAKNTIAERTKEKTHKEYCRLITKYILPNLGTKTLKSISKNDVLKLKYAYSQTKSQANGIIRALSLVLGIAFDMGIIESNACKKLPKYEVKPKNANILTSEQLEKFYNFIDELHQTRPINALAFRFLISADCTQSELFSLKKSHINANNITWITKGGNFKSIHLTQKVRDVIKSLNAHNSNNEYLFFTKGICTTDTLKKLWIKLRSQHSEFKDIRIEDLSKTYLATYYELDMVEMLKGNR